MSHPKQLIEYWADLERWREVRPGPDEREWQVAPEWAARFRSHYDRLLPVAEEDNLEAKYALASIHLVRMRYSDSESALAHLYSDSLSMTELLVAAARGGLGFSFDNLAVCGIGPDTVSPGRPAENMKPDVNRTGVMSTPYPFIRQIGWKELWRLGESNRRTSRTRMTPGSGLVEFPLW